MKNLDVKNRLIMADIAFRHQRWSEAHNLYRECLSCSVTEKHNNRSTVGMRLCELRIKQGIPRDTSSVRPTPSLLTQDLLSLLSKTPSTATLPGLDYIDDLICPSGTLNTAVILKHFLYSPWQTSLGIAAQIIMEEAIGSDAIRDAARSSFHDNSLAIANILSAYQTPVGLQELVILCASNQDKHSGAYIHQDLFYIIYEQRQSLTRLGSPFSFELSLRDILSRVHRYIISDHINVRRNESQGAADQQIFAGSIFLNESKFLQRCLFQHYNLVDRWCLVEGACRGYPARKVSQDGLSKDCSWLVLELFPDPLRKIRYIRHGWTNVDGEDAKSELRNRYLSNLNGDVLAVIDIDEFYAKESFDMAVSKVREGYSGVVVPQIHFWKDTKRFIIGGYYDISHMRFFSHVKGMRYDTNHNFPETPKDSVRLDQISKFKFERFICQTDSHAKWDGVYCFHMGFAKNHDDMKDKTQYYLNRGEAVTRPKTTASRAAWFDEDMPPECKILAYSQELPWALKQ